MALACQPQLVQPMLVGAWRLLLQIFKTTVMVSFLSCFSIRFSREVNFLTLIYNPSELENRLLSRFDTASQKRELSTMAECAKILSQVWIFFVSIYFISRIMTFL